MKTRIHYLVALILALTLVFAMAVTVSATETETPAHEDHCVCGGQLEGHSHEVLQWTAWGDEEAELTTLPSEDGNYYLTSDINLTKVWNVSGKTINLCLNGHTVNGAGTSGEGDSNNPNTIMVGNSTDSVAETSISKLVITDCQEGGKIQSNTNMLGGVIRFRNDPYATVEIYGGELKSTVAEGTKDGGAVYMLGGNLYLYGGSITGGDSVYQSGTGANTNGGAVCLTNGAQFTMYGGTINGGTDYSRGAGVAVRHADATFYMYGGTIQGGSSNFGDAIHCKEGIAYVEAGTLDVLSGNNLHKTDNGIITVKTANMPKGINVNTTEIASWLAEDSYIVYKGSYNAGTTSILEGDVVIGNHAPHCVCGENLSEVAAKNHTCGEDVQWIPLTAEHLANGTKGGVFLAGGNYFLAGNFATTGEVKVPNGMQVNICLNGYTWTSTSGGNASFRCVGQLSFCDCAGTGTVTSNSRKQGGMVFMHPGENTAGNCTLNIYGGNFVMTDGDATFQGGLIQVGFGTNPAVFNFYGGTLSGGTASKGGGVCVETGSATMNMYGGKISDCTSVQGSAIHVVGKLYIHGGEIFGDTQTVGPKGAISANSAARIYQYGGTVTGGVGDYTANKSEINGGAVFLEGSARYELHDGTVIGGTDYKRGGAVAVREANAAFYMYGGTISGGSAYYGNAIHNNNGTVYIDGGVIDSPITSGVGNFHINEGSQLTIKSATFPQGIDLYSGNKNYEVLADILAEGSYLLANGNYHLGKAEAIEGKVLVKNDGHSHCVCASVVAGHECKNIGWIAWTQTASLPSADGYYFLTEDVILTKYWEIKDKNIVLCLNGHTVTGAGGTVQTIMMGSTAEEDAELLCKLAITDCNENAGAIVSASNLNGAVLRTRAYGDIDIDLYNGTLDATCGAATNEGGAVSLNNGTFNMYGGTLNGYATGPDGTKAKNGGTLVVSGSGSEFNQYGGTITGGSVTGTDAYGGNIYVTGGAVNLYGGIVENGVAEYGAGNIYVKSGTLILDGGTITGGSVTGTARMGGNLWVAGGTANLVSGTVSDGEAPHGGNLRLNGGTMNLSGARVTGGIATIHGGNLSMTGGIFNMTGGEVTLGQARTSGGNMYVNAAGAGLYLNGGTVSDGTAVGGYGGNIYFNYGGSLGAVTVTGGTANGFGGSIYVAAERTVTIDGATITNDSETATAEKGGVIYTMGILNITNSTISGGYANTSPSGGTIAVAGGTTSITGSTLTAGWGSRGTCVNVYDNGNLIVTDSQFNGRTKAGTGTTSLGTCFWIEGNGNVKLVGNVVITGEGLDIVRDLRTGTTTIDVSELAIEGDEKISVKMQTNLAGQVVYAGTNAEAINMLEAFWAPEQVLSYDAESGWIEVCLLPLKGFDAQGTPCYFESWEDALAEDLSYIVVIAPVSGTISKDIVLDLNGVALTDVVIASGVTVRLIDSQTNDYTGAYGTLSGTVNGKVETYVTYGGKDYVVVCEENAYSAHRYDVKLTYINLKASQDALGYKAALYGDEIVMKYVTAFGFNMWVNDGPVVTRSKTGTQNLTLRLYGIMANNGGEEYINANTFVTLNVDGQEHTKTSGKYATSMKNVVLLINDTWTQYTDVQKKALKALYECYSTVMDNWFINEGVTNNIKAYEAPKS